MSEETTQKKPSYLPIAGALFFGIVVGVAMSDSDETAARVKREVEERIVAAEEALAAAESRASEAVEDAQAAIASGADQAAEAASEQMAALESKIAELTGAGESDVSSDEAFAALNNRVQVLAEQMAGIIGEMRAGGATARPASGSSGSGGAGSSESGSSSSGGSDSSAAQEESGRDVAALEEAIGENGLALSVGQSGDAGDTRVFMARLDPSSDSARVMVIGEGPTVMSVDDEPLKLGNGCALSLEGVADGRGFISVACDG